MTAKGWSYDHPFATGLLPSAGSFTHLGCRTPREGRSRGSSLGNGPPHQRHTGEPPQCVKAGLLLTHVAGEI